MDSLALNQVRGMWWNQIHNVYLQYAVDLGLPGAILFLTLLYLVFKAANSSTRQLAHKQEFRDLFLFAEALQVSLIVFAVSGFFYPVAYHFYFYYIAGLTLAMRSVTDHAFSVARASSEPNENIARRHLRVAIPESKA